MSPSRTIRRAVKATAASALVGAAPLVRLARRAFRGPEVRILGFHRVVDDPDALPPEVIRPLVISTRSFERLLAAAVQRVDVLPLDDAVQALAGKRRLTRDALVITFDDGYRDVYLRARPILARMGLPATVFVPSGLVGSDAPLPHDRLHALLVHARRAGFDRSLPPLPRGARRAMERVRDRLALSPLDALDELISDQPAGALAELAGALGEHLGEPPLDEDARVMNATELRACVDAGISVGAHTIGHVVLVHEPPARAKRELEVARDDLSVATGRPCTAFAWCNGLHSPSLREAARRAGYTTGVTTCDEPNHIGADPFALGRKVVWEEHLRGPLGFSRALAAAHLDDLFRLVMRLPIDGERPECVAEDRWRRRA